VKGNKIIEKIGYVENRDRTYLFKIKNRQKEYFFWKA
jgi:hypothetical protein